MHFSDVQTQSQIGLCKSQRRRDRKNPVDTCMRFRSYAILLKVSSDRLTHGQKISWNIPDDRYKDLAKLSDFYELDMKDSITRILDAIGSKAHYIETLSREYKVPVKLDTVLDQILGAGLDSMSLIFNKVLEKLEVKGLGIIDDFGYELDEEDFWFHYSLLKGSDLKIPDIFIHLEPGRKTLSTYPCVEVKKVAETAVASSHWTK